MTYVRTRVMYTLRSNNCALGLKSQFAIITCSHLTPPSYIRYIYTLQVKLQFHRAMWPLRGTKIAISATKSAVNTKFAAKGDFDRIYDDNYAVPYTTPNSVHTKLGSRKNVSKQSCITTTNTNNYYSQTHTPL